MLQTVEGIYRNGRIEFLESPPTMLEARVIVTFLPQSNGVNLRPRGIDEAQARELRWKMQAFAEDWDRPEMDVYDAE